jgi:hypothetical protein
LAAVLSAAGAVFFGCGSNSGDPASAISTAGASGGGSAAGVTSTGGSLVASGGAAVGGGTSGGSAVTAGMTAGGSTVTAAGSGPTGGGASGGGGGAPTATGTVYNPNFSEFSGADCQVADPKDVSIDTLPDLFTMADGTSRMAKKSDWSCQRAYLKKVIEKYIHGEKPGRPSTVTGTVSATSIKVHVEQDGKMGDFSASISLPSGASGPVPAIIGLGGGSLDSSIVKGEGVAIINYDNYGISNEDNKSGVFTSLYGTAYSSTSSQVAWAWGVSRIIDVLIDEQKAGRNNIIDPTGIGVTGCSRLGKGAFTIGAFDERIALGIPQESGTGGVSALRIVATAPVGPNGKAAETISGAASVKGWFGTDFANYMSKVNTIPGDMHSLAAMYAPRGLLILDNSRIGELCSNCAYATASAAAKVYEALGVGKNVAYNGGNPDDPQNHCSFYPATQGEPLKRAIRAHLTKKAPPDGRLEPQAVTTVDLSKWIPWSAPTLSDDLRWDSPPLTAK